MKSARSGIGRDMVVRGRSDGVEGKQQRWTASFRCPYPCAPASEDSEVTDCDCVVTSPNSLRPQLSHKMERRANVLSLGPHIKPIWCTKPD